MKTMGLLNNFILFTLLLACSVQHEDLIVYEKTEQPMNENSNMEKPYNYLALGDSYTIGESVATNQRFPVQLAEQLNKRGIPVSAPVIIARTGWTTDELEQGIKNANITEKYNLVTLLIGVNNQYRGRDTAEYRIQFSGLLQQALGFANNNAKHVVVISIPDWGVTPFGQSANQATIATEIDNFNRINTDETQKAGAHYVDVTGISRRAKNEPDLVASDGLHPSVKMYSMWVEELLPVAEEILKKQ